MGNVKHLTATGDNDADIYPRKYFRHYMYCDRCGSFDLKLWVEPENHETLAKRREKFDRIAGFCFWAFVFFIAITVIWALLYYLMSNGIEFQILTIFIAVFFLTGFVIFFSLAKRNGDKIKYLGVECAQCTEKYKYGSIFFDALDRNLFKYTIKDVPLPLSRNYWIEGGIVE
ncbi:hypothetical protein EGI22_08215 [Lacihabitans sp. LS3-19]|uniref:hypothetical protein n=1 Tax=Lacihabitans sp. LS3-19 TaxID=2487335 RepID=UPI0020CBC340|nr:hypothetical protein [Lacihabitans sp. LS3-19]MCP9767894.1 hypothetical protein [Lacihabitans sp. LS3-19]